MDAYLNKYLEAVKSICDSFPVKRLYVFGSVLSEKFNDGSDIDLLVEFSVEDPIQYKNAYFDLKYALEKVFSRPVDLVTMDSIRNPYFKKEVESKRQLMYQNLAA